MNDHLAAPRDRAPARSAPPRPSVPGAFLPDLPWRGICAYAVLLALTAAGYAGAFMAVGWIVEG